MRRLAFARALLALGSPLIRLGAALHRLADHLLPPESEPYPPLNPIDDAALYRLGFEAVL